MRECRRDCLAAAAAQPASASHPSRQPASPPVRQPASPPARQPAARQQPAASSQQPAASSQQPAASSLYGSFAHQRFAKRVARQCEPVRGGFRAWCIRHGGGDDDEQGGDATRPASRYFMAQSTRHELGSDRVLLTISLQSEGVFDRPRRLRRGRDLSSVRDHRQVGDARAYRTRETRPSSVSSGLQPVFACSGSGLNNHSRPNDTDSTAPQYRESAAGPRRQGFGGNQIERGERFGAGCPAAKPEHTPAWSEECLER